MTRISRLAGALVAGTLAVGAALPATAHAAKEQTSYAPTMLVLDASGSMTKSGGNGKTKMAAAKDAVHTVIDNAPDGSSMGLAVYGTSTGNKPEEKAAGCQDVRIAHEVRPLDRDALKASVDAVRARGYTPVGTALRKAADALPTDGPRSIVLVSDGRDTCAPPEPCEVAADLAEQGVDLIVHSVGFDVDAKARKELECVARETGGTYTDAPEADDLERKLPRVANTALRNYRPSGTPVEGTDELFSAPVLERGQYLDSIERDSEQFYAIEAPEGSTLYFSATMTDPTMTDGYKSVRTKVYGKDGERCRTGTDHGSDSTADVITSVVTWDTTQDPDDEECSGGGKYYISVERTDSGPEQAPLELLAGIEPLPGTPPTIEPAQRSVPFEAPTGEPQQATGAATFGTATTLDGAGVYTDEINFGEFVFYRVKVDWGQTLNVRVRFDKHEAGPGYISTRTLVYNPVRKELHKTHTGYSGKPVTMDPTEESVPVAYRNRELDDDVLAAQSIAGWYYIGVKVDDGSPSADAIGKPFRFYVDVDLRGDTQTAPDYQFPDGAGQGIFGDAPGTDGTASGESTENQTEDEAFPVGWVAGGGAAALLVTALVTIPMLRRRQRDQ